MQLLRILLLVGALGLAALTASAFLARWTQPFEILSHFRLYFAFAAAALAVTLLMLRQWRGAALAAAVLAANTAAIATSVTFTEQLSNKDAQTTRVIWSNLLRREQSLSAIAALARSEGADIVTLTELPPEGVAAVRRAFPDFQCFIADADTSSPTAPPVQRARPAPEAQRLHRLDPTRRNTPTLACSGSRRCTAALLGITSGQRIATT